MTSQSPNERFRNGNGYKSSPHFFHAIQKYGWNNFDHMILAQNLSKDEAIRKEIEIIALYRSNDAKFGYNITPGGEVCAGEDNPWFGKKHTAESKEKMSRAKKGVVSYLFIECFCYIKFLAVDVFHTGSFNVSFFIYPRKNTSMFGKSHRFHSAFFCFGNIIVILCNRINVCDTA